ncbi:MAG: rod shape-determining protein MreC [Clostridia bacterium]|jgi:rod shape-determining protein MreC|nr:rod shape-determining protein MreC [Clostridia bacterium]
MKRFLQSDSFKRLATIFAVILLGVICAAFSHNASSPFTTAMSVVFSPIQRLASSFSNEMTGLSASFTSSSVYIEQIEDLENQISEYRKQLADYEELKQKVTAYEEFYNIKVQNPDYQFAYGTVVSRDVADPYGSFVINAGSTSGIEVNDPVIYGDYVVGVVKKVNLSTCVVYTVLDPRVNIGAYESATREYGYVSGDSKLLKKGLCKLQGLDRSSSIVSGGIVCTSGSGGVFPHGLIIGEVDSVTSDKVTTSTYATIKPYTNLNDLTDVFIITSFIGQGESDITE